MPCVATTQEYGYVCPIRGCSKKNNRRFQLLGIMQHLIDCHKDILVKKLNLKKAYRTKPIQRQQAV